MKQIAVNFKGHMGKVVLGPVFKLIEAICELLVPLVMARMMDVGVGGKDTATLWKGGLLLFVLATGGVVTAIICQYFAASAAGHFGKGLRQQLYRHVMSLSGDEVGAFGSGGLITRVTNDTNQMVAGVNMFIRLGVRVPFLMVGGLVMALVLNWRIGLVFLAAIPVIGLLLFLIMKWSLPSYTKIQKGQDTLARLSGENLSGVRVIRAFSRQRDEQEAFSSAADQLTALMNRVGRLSAALNPLTSFAVSLALCAIIVVGGRLAFEGHSSPGQVFAMVSYMNMILLAMLVGANLIVLFTRAIASTKRVAAVLQTAPAIKDGPGATPNAMAPAAEFKQVSFAYHRGAAPALSQISFALQPGDTMGIIGGTGSGKTTLANLLLRYFDPDEGEVLAGGANLKDYTLHGLRQGIGLVPQKAVLFSGTVGENLRLGAAASDQQLWKALEIAQAADFVRKMEGGLEAQLNEGGKNLSGGQKQRLCIARALVKNPRLLILDDAASALDYATDARLRKALKTLAEERRHSGAPLTTIIITQRAAGIRHANQILVLDEGRLAGAGTHSQLLAGNMVYQEICASQGIYEEEGSV